MAASFQANAAHPRSAFIFCSPGHFKRDEGKEAIKTKRIDYGTVNDRTMIEILIRTGPGHFKALASVSEGLIQSHFFFFPSHFFF